LSQLLQDLKMVRAIVDSPRWCQRRMAMLNLDGSIQVCAIGACVEVIDFQSILDHICNQPVPRWVMQGPRMHKLVTAITADREFGVHHDTLINEIVRINDEHGKHWNPGHDRRRHRGRGGGTRTSASGRARTGSRRGLMDTTLTILERTRELLQEDGSGWMRGGYHRRACKSHPDQFCLVGAVRHAGRELDLSGSQLGLIVGRVYKALIQDHFWYDEAPRQQVISFNDRSTFGDVQALLDGAIERRRLRVMHEVSATEHELVVAGD
jgi:hypothetical protein